MTDEETKNTEEVTKEDIRVEEEAAEEQKSWTEEISVAGSGLIDMVKNLVHETSIRRLVIKNGDKQLLEIPLLLGIAGIAMWPMYAALGVIGALATDYSILVERVAEKATEA